MKWEGKNNLVVGTVDDDGILEEHIIKPGDEIPAAVQKLLASNLPVINVPYRDKYDRGAVMKAHHKASKESS